ncbi:MAG TPA: hypothetical protein VEX60_11355 [Pyrinomonadaceae bacterium]|nr:hypothetical protein [Pyrinomonadaceae bacterium]
MKPAQPPNAQRPGQFSNSIGPINSKAGFAPRVGAAAGMGLRTAQPAPRIGAAHVSPAVAALQRKAAAPPNARQLGRGVVIQRKPLTINNPTNKTDGLHIDTKNMKTIGSDSVPEHIIAVMKNPTPGSVPSVAPPGWSWLQQRVQKLKGSWVRFHIINRLLGGRGDKTWNLVPTSVAVNNYFSQNIEEDAKASAKKKWTYIDVELHYNPLWPAPIPDRIEAEWGSWSSNSNKWVVKNTETMHNADITQIGTNIAYVRGVNITIEQLTKTRRKVPTGSGSAFKDFLRDERFDSDSLIEFWNSIRQDFIGEETDQWVDQIWLDETETVGEYQAVVKKLPVLNTKKRKRNSTGLTGGKNKKKKN